MPETRPHFGLLHDLFVVCAGSAITAPFCAQIYAENGADVVHVENPKFPDTIRRYPYAWAQEHRNVRQLTLDVRSEDGRKVFERLISRCDVFLENSKGGTWSKWGITDEYLWNIKPDLVIVHISGYGLYGHPDYLGRASYDYTGQAFGGYTILNGTPEEPTTAKPSPCDYVTGLQAMWSSLAALHRAKQDGKGESIDLAMYEAILRIQYWLPMAYFAEGTDWGRGGMDLTLAGRAGYKTKDNQYVCIHFGGGAPMLRGLPLVGLENDPDFMTGDTVRRNDPRAEKYIAALDKYCAERNMDEIIKEMNAAQVPCEKLMTYKDMETDPHYLAREDFVEYYSPNVDKVVKGTAPVPKFKNNPQQIWRGGEPFGYDNEVILKELGYSDAEIRDFYQAKVISKESEL